jgi:hypothetical protein
MPGTLLAFVNLRDRSVTCSAAFPGAENVFPLHLLYGPGLFRPENLKEHDLSQEQLLLAAKLEHEIDHLHRFLGTSVGLLLCRIFRCQVDLIFSEIGQSNGNLNLPFSMSTAAMSRFHGLAMLEEAIFASSPRFSNVQANVLNEALKKLDMDLEVDPFDADQCVAPMVETQLLRRSIQTPFGAACLFEYFGVSRELGLRKMASVRYSDTTLMMHTRAYQLAGQVFRSKFQEMLPRQPLPNDHYLASDIALWIPASPNGLLNRPSGCKYTWNDFQPGHRYIAILGLLDRNRFSPATRPLDDAYELWFAKETRRICSMLDWPTPQDIASAWLTVLEDNAHPSDFFVRDSPEIVRGAKKMLLTRIRYPAKAAHGYWPANNDTDLWFGQIKLLEENGSRTIACDETIQEWKQHGYSLPPAMALSSALELLVQKREERLMGPELLQRYRSEIRRVCDDLSQYGKRHFGFGVLAGRE